MKKQGAPKLTEKEIKVMSEKLAEFLCGLIKRNPHLLEENPQKRKNQKVALKEGFSEEDFPSS